MIPDRASRSPPATNTFPFVRYGAVTNRRQQKYENLIVREIRYMHWLRWDCSFIYMHVLNYEIQCGCFDVHVHEVKKGSQKSHIHTHTTSIYTQEPKGKSTISFIYRYMNFGPCRIYSACMHYMYAFCVSF